MSGNTKLETKLLKELRIIFFVLRAVTLGKKGLSKNFQKQKLSNKETHFTPQSDNTKYNSFKFISWLNLIEGYQNLSLVRGAKSLLISL